MEGHDTLSRRILRLTKAAVAISLASAPVIAFSMPAFAGSQETAPRYEWWLNNLRVPQAWRSSTGSGILVAVLSDGVAANQRYLAGSVITGPDFTGSARKANGRYYGLIGTSLASLIVGHGVADARSGSRWMEGVAPAAKVLSVRVTLSPGDPLWSNSRIAGRLPDSIAAGIRYAVDHGASVIDLPADPGVPDPAISTGSSAAAGLSPTESAAVAFAERRGVLLVAPAGDDGQSGDAVNYPAAYPGVIAVGAFGKTFVKAPFSSHRSYVTLTAAGQGVVAPDQTGFKTFNSTTAASAIVAGIAALVRSEFPNLTASQVRAALTDGTAYRPKGGQTDGSGFGTVDATGALTSATRQSPPHARPAMLGAVPRSRPVSPLVASSGSIIAHDLTGDAEVSALVLAAALVPIVLYGMAARRRERHEALLAAERSQHGIGRSGHGSMLADPLLEFFGPQHARPEPVVSRPIPTSRFQPRPTLTGRSTMSASLTARPSLPPPVARSAPPPRSVQPLSAPPLAGAAPAAQAGFNGSQPSHEVPDGAGYPAPDIVMGPTVRHAPVSGAPPWEPAPAPTSELPWAVIAPQSGQRPPIVETPSIPPPPDSVWDSPAAIRASAPRSLFEPGPPPRPPQPASAPPAPPVPTPTAPPGQPTSWRDLPGTDSDRGPIFVWQPMESADQVSAADPRRTGRDRRRD